MQPIVTVTGASGRVGSALSAHLLKQGVRVRAIARDAARLAPLVAQGAEAHVGTLDDTRFLAAAFRGADAVFALLPPSPPNAPDYLADQARLTSCLAQALDWSGVEHVVALSGQGASRRVGLFALFTGLEEALRCLDGLAVVALRSCFQMTNHLGAIPLIKQMGINASARRADLPIPMIAPRDVAAVAAEYLMAPSFRGYQVRDLLGPRDYTPREATAILGAAIGKPDLPYVEWSYEEARASLLCLGFSTSRAEATLQLQRAFNEEPRAIHPPRDASTTTPTTLEEFARDTFAPAYQAR